MKITNTSAGIRTVNVRAGKDQTKIVSLAPGNTSDDLDVIETAAFKARVKSGEFTTSGSAAKADKANGGGETATFTVTDKGSGWFAISHGGKEVTKSLRKEAVEGFDKLSDEKKAAFVEANKAEG